MNHSDNDTYNKSGFIAFIFSMVFSLGFMAYVALFSGGVDLGEIPQEATSGEQVVADGSAAAPAIDASTVTDPWLSSEGLIAHGQKVYGNNCAICHGPQGKGDGAAGMGLNPPPRNLVSGGWKQGGTSIELFETIRNGMPGTSMAAFGHIPKNDRWAMVHWIRSITEDKPADDEAKLAEFGNSAK